MKEELIAILRGIKPEDVLPIVDVLIKNGVTTMEVSLSEEKEGLECTNIISNRYGNKVKLGVGTVTSKRQVDASLKAGASFIITPGWDRELSRYVLERNVTIYPGVFTPGDVMQAHAMGIETVKLFPANVLGTGYVKSLKGPFPRINVMAVGGINEENILDYRRSGCDSFAVGSELVPRGATKENLDEIAKRAKRFVSLLSQEVNE